MTTSTPEMRKVAKVQTARGAPNANKRLTKAASNHLALTAPGSLIRKNSTGRDALPNNCGMAKANDTCQRSAWDSATATVAIPAITFATTFTNAGTSFL